MSKRKKAFTTTLTETQMFARALYALGPPIKREGQAVIPTGATRLTRRIAEEVVYSLGVEVKRSAAHDNDFHYAANSYNEAMKSDRMKDRLTRKAVVAEGRVCAQFVLPLELAPPVNKYAEMPSWLRHRLKRQALEIMFGQHGGRAKSPLAGRPLLYCVRFSSRPTDAECAWHKIAVDRLTVKHQGLGFLVDDSPLHVAIKSRWRKASPRQGFVYLELWGGDHQANEELDW